MLLRPVMICVSVIMPGVIGKRRPADCKIASVGFDDDVEIGLFRRLVVDRVGGDLHHPPVEPAIGREIVGGDLDQRLVADLDEGDVARLDARFDQQFVAHRDDFHDLLPGRDEAADGRHLEVVDDAVDR